MGIKFRITFCAHRQQNRKQMVTIQTRVNVLAILIFHAVVNPMKLFSSLIILFFAVKPHHFINKYFGYRS
jgi:hypothetical protein